MIDEQKQDYIASLYQDGHWFVSFGIPSGNHIIPVGLVAGGFNLKD